jgi:hypothetical protein
MNHGFLRYVTTVKGGGQQTRHPPSRILENETNLENNGDAEKVKLSLCLIKYDAMKTYWGGGGDGYVRLDPLFFYHGFSSM